MLSVLSGLFDSIPPTAKAIILIVLGFLLIRAGWHGGSELNTLWGVAK